MRYMLYTIRAVARQWPRVPQRYRQRGIVLLRTRENIVQFASWVPSFQSRGLMGRRFFLAKCLCLRWRTRLFRAAYCIRVHFEIQSYVTSKQRRNFHRCELLGRCSKRMKDTLGANTATTRENMQQKRFSDTLRDQRRSGIRYMSWWEVECCQIFRAV